MNNFNKNDTYESQNLNTTLTYEKWEKERRVFIIDEVQHQHVFNQNPIKFIMQPLVYYGWDIENKCLQGVIKNTLNQSRVSW